MEHEDLTRKIIGVAYDVHNELKPGFLESVYENAMLIALREANLQVAAQVPIPVHFRGHTIGDFIADLLVEDTVIVELKAVRNLAVAHEVQLVNYLTATQKPVGLLFNFGAPSLEIKRKTLHLPS